MNEHPSIALQVRRKWREAEDVVALELVAPDGGELPPFSAGACIDLELPMLGVARSYSLANAPHERHRYLLAVYREPQSLGGSAAIHDRVREGDRLAARGPRNEFALAGGAPYSVLFAGGIGVTPLLTMAEHLHRQGSPFELHYAARSERAAAFVERLRRSAFAHRVRFYFGHRGGGERLRFAEVLRRVPRLSALYVCGPERFIAQAREDARRAGWPDERLHWERFSPSAPEAEIPARGR